MSAEGEGRLRIVLDTNVLFAALATRGLCEALLEACLHAHTIVLSEHILSELQANLKRKLRAERGLLEAADVLLREHAEIVVPAAVAKRACRDASDLPVLGTALAGRADALATGDADLLALGRFGDIPILTPRQMYERVR